MKKSIIFLSILIIILLAGCSCSDSNTNHAESVSPSSTSRELSAQDYIGNTASGGGGYIAELNGIYYFANPDDNNRLYQMNADFSNKVKLSSLSNDSAAIYIQIHSGKLFYLHTTHTEDAENPWLCELYSYDLQNKSETKILGDNICSYTISDNFIYYSTLDTKNLCRSTLDGTNAQVLAEGPAHYPISPQVAGLSLYYGCGEAIVKSSPDGTDIRQFGCSPQTLLVYSDELFYLSGGALLKLSTDDIGSNPEIFDLNITDVVCFTISENVLYYSTFDEKIYRCDLNGESISFIVDGYAPIVLKDYIFYLDSNDRLQSIPKQL